MAFVLIIAALFLAALALLEVGKLADISPWWGVVLLGVAMLIGGASLPDPRGWFHRPPKE